MHLTLRTTILTVLAFLLSPVAAVLTTAFTAIGKFLPDYRPDAKTSLLLDRITRAETVDAPARSRFRAFIDSCLNHDLFSAGRFHIDPGRAAA